MRIAALSDKSCVVAENKHQYSDQGGWSLTLCWPHPVCPVKIPG